MPASSARASATSSVALALAQVVSRGLAGACFVAEDAQDVVAQLEGQADREAEASQRVELVSVGASQGGADHERLLHAVAR